MIELVAIKFSHAVAGILGGLTAYLVDPKLHWRDGAALIIIGGVSSYYLVPALTQYMGLSVEMASFFAYCTGIIARAFILQAKERVAKLLLDGITSKIQK